MNIRDMDGDIVSVFIDALIAYKEGAVELQ